MKIIIASLLVTLSVGCIHRSPRCTSDPFPDKRPVTVEYDIRMCRPATKGRVICDHAYLQSITTGVKNFDPTVSCKAK